MGAQVNEAEEREYLDYLRLKAKAAGASSPSATNKTPGMAESALRGAEQGLTLGFADEAGAGLQAGAMKLMRMLPKGVADKIVGGDFRAEEADAGKTYTDARNQNRRLYRTAQEANPGAYLGGELAGAVLLPVPGAAALKTGTMGARLAKGAALGAGIGGAAGVGHSEADSASGVAADGLKGVAYGAAGGTAAGALGIGLEKLAGKAKAGITRAVADETAKQAAKREDGIRSAAGKIGGDTAATFKTRDRLMEAVSNPDLPEDVRAAAQAGLDDPRMKIALERAYREYAKKAPEQLGRIEAGEAAREGARAVDVASETAKGLARPFATQVMPRLKTYASRAIPIAIGSSIGGWPGAITGGIAAAAMGRPGTAFSNMVKSPAFRKGAWESVDAMVGANPETPAWLARPAQKTVERSLEQLGGAERLHAIAEALLGKKKKNDDEEIARSR